MALLNSRLVHTSRLWPYLQLVRPANVITALADVLAGFAMTGLWLHLNGETWASSLAALGWLLIATAGLYAGGIVFNDVLDAELDRHERPERSIPSGQVALSSAALLGGLLLLGGVAAALQVGSLSAALAAIIALTVLFYDAYGKHRWLGPLNMGVCRGLNLLLGASALPVIVAKLWFVALIPIAYIAAVTLTSRGEVHGGKRQSGAAALLLIGMASCGVVALGLTPRFELLAAAPFLLLFWWRVVPVFLGAARHPRPDNIRTAVKTGVIMLIVLNASIAAGFAGFWYGLMVALLLPISIGLARVFAVT